MDCSKRTKYDLPNIFTLTEQFEQMTLLKRIKLTLVLFYSVGSLCWSDAKKWYL